MCSRPVEAAGCSQSPETCDQLFGCSLRVPQELSPGACSLCYQVCGFLLSHQIPTAVHAKAMNYFHFLVFTCQCHCLLWTISLTILRTPGVWNPLIAVWFLQTGVNAVLLRKQWQITEHKYCLMSHRQQTKAECHCNV